MLLLGLVFIKVAGQCSRCWETGGSRSRGVRGFSDGQKGDGEPYVDLKDQSWTLRFHKTKDGLGFQGLKTELGSLEDELCELDRWPPSALVSWAVRGGQGTVLRDCCPEHLLQTPHAMNVPFALTTAHLVR